MQLHFGPTVHPGFFFLWHIVGWVGVILSLLVCRPNLPSHRRPEKKCQNPFITSLIIILNHVFCYHLEWCFLLCFKDEKKNWRMAGRIWPPPPFSRAHRRVHLRSLHLLLLSFIYCGDPWIQFYIFSIKTGRNTPCPRPLPYMYSSSARKVTSRTSESGQGVPDKKKANFKFVVLLFNTT